MRPIRCTPMIGLLLERLSQSRLIDHIILATSDDPKNQPLADFVSSLGYTVYRGSEQDVLDRYYQATQLTDAEVVVRVTGDCPLIDPALVDAVIAQFKAGDMDYASNTEPATFPDGLDTEVFSRRA